jgi:hypothetical protein
MVRKHPKFICLVRIIDKIKDYCHGDKSPNYGIFSQIFSRTVWQQVP